MGVGEFNYCDNYCWDISNIYLRKKFCHVIDAQTESAGREYNNEQIVQRVLMVQER